MAAVCGLTCLCGGVVDDAGRLDGHGGHGAVQDLGGRVAAAPAPRRLLQHGRLAAEVATPDDVLCGRLATKPLRRKHTDTPPVKRNNNNVTEPQTHRHTAGQTELQPVSLSHKHTGTPPIKRNYNNVTEPQTHRHTAGQTELQPVTLSHKHTGTPPIKRNNNNVTEPQTHRHAAGQTE